MLPLSFAEYAQAFPDIADVFLWLACPLTLVSGGVD